MSYCNLASRIDDCRYEKVGMTSANDTQQAGHEIAALLTRPIDYIRWGASRFAQAGLRFGHGTDNAVDEAAQLVLHAIGLDHTLPDIYLQATLTLPERKAIITLLDARIETRQPAPYLTGTAWFAGLPFYVDERVIIPRSPIAELIGDEFQPWLGYREPLSILDLCAGGGAIAIACALAFPEARVVASDASDDALDVARSNVERHNIGPQIECVQSDLFAGLGDERFDLIVSNPPYVTHDEWQTLDAEYHHEPGFAFTGDCDTLDLLKRLLFAAPAHLAEDGMLVIEVGYTAFALEQTFPDLPVAWVELSRGGFGVGVLEAEDLDAWVAVQRHHSPD